MSKITNWETSFIRVVEDYSPAEFIPGKTDCLCFIRDIIEVESGIDIMEGYKGSYSDLDQGYEIANRVKGSLFNILDSYFERVPLDFIQRGDACILELASGHSFGVVSLDPRNLLVKGQAGLRVIKLKSLINTNKTFWRIECPP